MNLRRLSLTNFRSYARLDCDIPGRILILSGGNAQGKTSFLEALFYCASFTSPLAGNDRQLIHFAAADDPIAVARIVAFFEKDGRERKIEVRIIRDTLERGGKMRKEILVNDLKSGPQKAIGTFPAVLFLPQMTRILEGAPDDRRRYLNIMLSQSIPEYAAALTRYKQLLTRRNALLKLIAERHSDPGQLEYWDQLMLQPAALLIRRRAEALRYLSEHGAEIHNTLTDGRELLRVRYLPGFDPSGNGDLLRFSQEELETAFRIALARGRSADLERGITLLGPHRDDFSVCDSKTDLSIFGSRGQIRTALLSLKFCEVDWMTMRGGSEPLLLLDETLAELDERRSAFLLNRLEQSPQAILTTTDCTHFPNSFLVHNAVRTVRNGVLS